MKNIIFLILIVTSLFSDNWNISCKGQIQSANIKELPYSFGAQDSFSEYNEIYESAIDTINYSMPFYDSNSPACGGDGSSNKMIFINGNGSDASYNFYLHDEGGYPIHSYNPATQLYENATIFVNNTPCMPLNSTSMTFGVYDWNNHTNFGLTTAYDLTNVHEVVEETLTSAEIALLKTTCEPDVSDGNNRDYTALITKVADNTEPISNGVDKLTNLNSKADIRNDSLVKIEDLLISIDDSLSNNQDNNSTNNNQDSNDTNNYIDYNISSPLNKIDSDLIDYTNDRNINDMLDIDSDKSEFTNDFKNALSDSYSNYSDVFGFGGYGSAPAPISFNLLGRSYTVFDVSNIGSNNIELIRNTFLLFSYLFGFILIFRTV